MVSVLRRQVAASLITPAQASAALDDLVDRLSVFPTTPLLRRAWQLREVESTGVVYERVKDRA